MQGRWGIRLVLMLASWAFGASAFAGPAEPDRDAARALVYGGAVWHAESARRLFDEPVPIEVTEVFRARYRELGQDKLMLGYQLTPGPRETYQCHACHAGLGAAVLTPDGQGWRVEARGLWLGRGGPFLQNGLSLMELGGGRWGLHSRYEDVSQGFETRRELLFIEHRGRVQLALDQGFNEKPGPGACGPTAAPQTAALSRLDVGSGEAPRLELLLRYNLGACPNPRSQTLRSRFELRDGVFLPF